MNEPKRDTVIEAAKTKWPRLIAAKTNHRKHELTLHFGKGQCTLKAKSWRAMLELIEQTEIQFTI
jgi:hypothetical protein